MTLHCGNTVTAVALILQNTQFKMMKFPAKTATLTVISTDLSWTYETYSGGTKQKSEAHPLTFRIS